LPLPSAHAAGPTSGPCYHQECPGSARLLSGVLPTAGGTRRLSRRAGGS
jgi:hypothetical protein